ISRSSDWILTNRPSFDSSYREESNDMYYISVALILTELFRFEFYNKNLTLFDPISTLFRPSGGPGPDHFDPGGLISVSCIIQHHGLTIRQIIVRCQNLELLLLNHLLIHKKVWSVLRPIFHYIDYNNKELYYL